MTGFDPAKMGRLPDTAGMKNQVVIARGHRNSYDHAIRAAGVTLVEAGISDRLGGSGVRDVEAWEIESAITAQTAAVFYLARPGSLPALPEVVEVAHRAGVPVLVDAAAELPPITNLRHFISTGADLVAFSGGKAIGGPSASGILCGKRQLIGVALLQQLDLDYQFDEWEPPRDLVTTNELRGLPRHGIGRSCKVGKEQIVGLLTALKRFFAEGDSARRERLTGISRRLIAGMDLIAGLDADIVTDADRAGVPVVRLRVRRNDAAMSAGTLARRLRDGTPRILVDTSRRHEGILLLVPDCLTNDEPETIGRRAREIFAGVTSCCQLPIIIDQVPERDVVAALCQEHAAGAEGVAYGECKGDFPYPAVELAAGDQMGANQSARSHADHRSSVLLGCRHPGRDESRWP